MLSEFSLEGRVAVVTGASRSMGRAIAIAMAEAGADVAICGRWAEGLEQVASEIVAVGGEVETMICDVSDPLHVKELLRRTATRFRAPDIMVANAGVFQEWLPSEEVTLEEWDRVVSVDLRGAWLCCHEAGQAMIGARRPGSIIAVSSIAGQVALRRTVSYTAAKFGVVGFIKALAVDWARYGIRANALTPGFIERDDEVLQRDPESVEFVTSRTPLGRWGKPRELATAAVFLASDAASYVTGTTLAVDGGWLAE